MGALNPEKGGLFWKVKLMVVVVVVVNLNPRVMGGLLALQRRIGPEGLRLNSFCITSSHFTAISFLFSHLNLREKERRERRERRQFPFLLELERERKERNCRSFLNEREREGDSKRRERKEAGDIQGLSADNAYRQCSVLREAKEASLFEIGAAKGLARVFSGGEGERQRQTTESGIYVHEFFLLGENANDSGGKN